MWWILYILPWSCLEFETKIQNRNFQGESSECSEEQVQSSFARQDALQVGSQIGDEHNSAESTQVDTRINGREQTAGVKSTTVVKEVNMEENTIGSGPAACSDGSDSTEYEVCIVFLLFLM